MLRRDNPVNILSKRTRSYILYNPRWATPPSTHKPAYMLIHHIPTNDTQGRLWITLFNVEAPESSAIDIYVSNLSIFSETAFISCYDEIPFLTRECVIHVGVKPRNPRDFLVTVFMHFINFQIVPLLLLFNCFFFFTFVKYCAKLRSTIKLF